MNNSHISFLTGVKRGIINFVPNEDGIKYRRECFSQDIFRKYPNRYESIISTLCENLDTLDEPEARASMIWIIGEYAERIDNADELLESFVEGFQDENTQVRHLYSHPSAQRSIEGWELSLR